MAGARARSRPWVVAADCRPALQTDNPFTGTGTFIVRLLQSGLIRPPDLLRKYRNELHANEIVLLAYYIAAINIEEGFHRLHDSRSAAADKPALKGRTTIAQGNAVGKLAFQPGGPRPCVVRVSMETVKIVRGLPALNERP